MRQNFYNLIINTAVGLLFFLCSKKTFGQSADFSSINNQFRNYRENVLQEKLYAHTDKDFYLAGESVWFKLYNVDANFHEVLDVSKVAYIEILNKDHVPVLQTKIALKKGMGSGSFELPPAIGSGNYIFRAYTNWMKNFDPDFYFEKPITVVNTLRNDASIETKILKPEYDVQFFPEGGNLVNGIESTVGFRVAEQGGSGVACNGIIVNQNRDTIAHYSTFKFGIGSFRFLPVKNNTYKAIITFDNGTTMEKVLPTAYEEGYVLQVRRSTPGQIIVRVEASPNYNGQNIYLFVHCRQQIMETRTITLNNNAAEFILDETHFAEGISHFTIFNSAKRPVCERLLFKKPTHHLSIESTPDRQQYESRKKVTIDVLTKDEGGNPLPANLSLSVYRFDSLSFFDQNTIESYLWLSSDLKGNVESPSYYFTNAGEETDKAVDNLMLTHGWRRFNWEKVLNGDKPLFAFVPEYSGHVVSATVVNKETGIPEKGVDCFLSVPGTHFKFYTGQSDEKGEVNFYTKDLYGKHELFAQAGGKSRKYRIDVKTPFSENFSSKFFPSFTLPNVSGFILQAKSIDMQIQKLYTGEQKFILLPTDTTFFYQPTNTYLLDNYVRFPTMEEVLREYVREIVVNKQNNNLLLAAGRRDVTGIVYRYEPLTMVDGVPLTDDINKIFAFDPFKVKALDIVNRGFIVGNSMFEGIINFRTYKGNAEGLAVDPTATVLDYEGLQLQREYFAPLYETQNQFSSRMPDFRNLLHWVPALQTNASGRQQISFYTSDLAGKYIVFIEGLAAKGRAGTKSFTLGVINPLLVQK